MEQRVESLGRFHPDTATYAAIAARRPAPRDKLFAPKSRHAVAAIAGLYPDFYAIEKHYALFYVFRAERGSWAQKCGSPHEVKALVGLYKCPYFVRASATKKISKKTKASSRLLVSTLLLFL